MRGAGDQTQGLENSELWSTIAILPNLLWGEKTASYYTSVQVQDST